ncbi:MAG: SurA N-terminal domain-containing protein [Desulfovibrionaceae bacterium]|nr:SurA N-terminal domain-containing protein [Desulfovibrionaceae bacterium]
MKIRHYICSLFFCLLPFQADAALNEIVAVVNGEMISSFDLEREVAPEMLRLGMDPKKKGYDEAFDRISRMTLDRMINSMVMTQEAKRQNISVSEDEVQAGLQVFMQRSRLTPEEFRKQLKAQRITEEQFRERIREKILQERLLMHNVGMRVVVTKDEIEAYYNAHRGAFSRRENVHCALIVYPPSVQAEQWAGKIRSGKISFEKAVREISVGPRTEVGGDIGTVARKDLDPSWQNRLMSMNPGDVSPIFELRGLKAQIKLLDFSGESDMTLEEASPQIEAILREPKIQERMKDFVESVRKKAVVDRRL